MAGIREYFGKQQLIVHPTAVSAPTKPVSSANTVSTSAVNASERKPPTLDLSRYLILTHRQHLTFDLTRSAAPLRYPRTRKQAHRIDIARMGSGIEMVFTHGMEFMDGWSEKKISC